MKKKKKTENIPEFLLRSASSRAHLKILCMKIWNEKNYYETANTQYAESA